MQPVPPVVYNGEELPYDLAVFVGRFQPFHNGHLFCVREALKRSRFLLIVIGSANEARRPDSLPFTADERERMISACLTKEERSRVVIRQSEDVGNLTTWVSNTRGIANEVIIELGLYGPGGDRYPKVTLVGHSKDKSSYYIKSFGVGPNAWDNIEVPSYENSLSATNIRTELFDPNKTAKYLSTTRELPKEVASYLRDWVKTPPYQNMVDEWKVALETRKSWAAAPYPPTFITIDSCVIQSGHVLLIKRKAMPGKGLWALPGGFLEQDEYLLDGAIRELYEETKIKVPEAVVLGSFSGNQVFDAPNRSMRGRTVTHCFLFHLRPKPPVPLVTETAKEFHVRLLSSLALPKVKGSDDAVTARWWPLDEVRRDMMFEDHYYIIQSMKEKISD